MQSIRAALDAEYGKGEKLVFGEPWAAGPSAARRGTHLAAKRALPGLGAGVGAFCDATRDLAKGHILHAERPGFVNGGTARLDDLTPPSPLGRAAGRAVRGEYGQPDHQLPFQPRRLDAVGQTGHHDGSGAKVRRPHAGNLRANRLAAAFYFGCQGHLFLLSGEEFARTKQGVKGQF